MKEGGNEGAQEASIGISGNCWMLEGARGSQCVTRSIDLIGWMLARQEIPKGVITRALCERDGEGQRI